MDAVRMKRPKKTENQQLVSPSWRCSKTPVGFGQGFLSKERCDNFGEPPILSLLCSRRFYMLPRNQNWRERAFVMTLTSLRMRQKSCKGFHKIVSRNAPSTFTGASRSVYLHKGTNLNEV